MHLFEGLSGPVQFVIGLVAAGLGGLGWALMLRPGRVMQQRGTSVVCFEVAGSEERVAEIFKGWGPEGRSAARESLRYDSFLFVPGYAVLMAIVAAGCAQEVGFRTVSCFGTVTRVAAWMALAAGALDLLENVGLTQVLHGRVRVFGRVAKRCAYLKFALIAAVLAWLVLVALPIVASPTVTHAVA